MPRVRKTVLPDEGLTGLRQNKAAATERDFPHIVEIELPLNGFDVGLSHEMTTFHHLRNIRPVSAGEGCEPINTIVAGVSLIR
jgi:hypothetical protein